MTDFEVITNPTPVDDKPVFVFGMAPRTGSTAVQRILNACKNAYIWGEPGGPLDQVWAMYLGWLTSQGLPNDHVIDGPGSPLEGKPHLAWSCSHLPGLERFLNGIEAYLRTSFQNEGTRIWGFKDIRYTTGLPVLKYALPHAKLIFVTRDPLQIVRSAYVMYGTWERSATRYEQSWKMAMIMLNNYPDDCLVVDQGAMAQDPDKVVRQIYRFLDEPVTLEAYQAAGTVTGYIEEKDKEDPPLERFAVYQELVRPMHEILCGFCPSEDPGLEGVTHAPGVLETIEQAREKWEEEQAQARETTPAT